MKLTKTFFLSLSILLLICSNLFSQPKEIEELLKNNNQNLKLLNFEELENKFIEENFESDRLFYSRQKNIYETFDVVDSVAVMKADSSLETYSFTYDSNGRISSKFVRKWDKNLTSFIDGEWVEGAWVNYLLRTHTYDSNGNMTLELYERWENQIWVNYLRWTHTYDSNGNMTSELSERWENQIWVNKWRWTYTYDSNGNMTSYLFERWENQNWVNEWRSTYTYDSNGNRTSYLSERWENQNWVNYLRRAYTYEPNGNMTSYLSERWESQNWVNYLRRAYTYEPNGNMTSYLSERWENQNWVNYLRGTSTYDSNGNRTSYLFEIWENPSWILFNNYLFIFNSSGYIFIEGAKIEIYYKLITDIEKKEMQVFEFSLSQNYPNPFNPSTTISYTVAKSGFVQLKVYDILGSEVATLVNETQSAGYYDINFNASNLSSGIYFYKITAMGTNNYTMTKKMILLR